MFIFKMDRAKLAKVKGVKWIILTKLMEKLSRAVK